MHKKLNILNFILFDILILFLSLIVCNWYKGNTFTWLINAYSGGIWFFFVFWFVLSALGRKYTKIRYGYLAKSYLRIILVNFIFLALLAGTVFALKYEVSRLLTFGTIFLATFIELLFTTLFHLSHHTQERYPLLSKVSKIFILVITDFLLISLAFLFIAWLKPATRRIVLPSYATEYVIFVLSWLFYSWVTGKFEVIIKEKEKFANIINRMIPVNLSYFAIVLVAVFAFKQLQYSRLLVVGTLSISIVLEFIFAVLLFYSRKFKKENPSYASSVLVSELELPEEEPSEPTKIKQPERYNPSFADKAQLKESILLKLLGKYLKNFDSLFEFLNDRIALENIHRGKSLVLKTRTLFNFENYDPEELEFFINLHKINDFRRINKYLIKINKIIKSGGVFVGCAETITERRRKILQKFPSFIGKFVYFLDFIFNRIFPKVGFLKGLYFSLTHGQNRPLSKCEVLGRLYFCGFEIVDEREMHNRLYFIAKKIKEPSRDENPSYAPLFKMKRHGKHGKPIYVYKFRTMHPYAEYLQHYMVEYYGYGDKGKVERDFRVTTWGKAMRRLWLDEFPQLLNFLKGDLALVGVRPLSKRFLKEYPEELKKKRLKYKPGCIPPYVALKMQAVEEYIESERIYLNEKKKHPFWTDIKYFWWAVYNILTNKIRSE